MAPNLDSKRIQEIQQLAANDSSLHLGFQVKYPWGTVAGFLGVVPKLGYEAMSEETARDLIAREVKESGLEDDSGFTLLPIAAMFVK